MPKKTTKKTAEEAQERRGVRPVIEWVNPPVRLHQKSAVGWFSEFESAVQNNPGRWACIKHYPIKADGYNMALALTRWYGARHWEFTTRTAAKGGVNLYVRYNGGDED